MDDKLTLLDLQQERQRISKGLLDYICRSKNLSLMCYDPVKEETLIDICIDGMLYEYRTSKVVIYNYVFCWLYSMPNLIVISFNLLYPVFIVRFNCKGCVIERERV